MGLREMFVLMREVHPELEGGTVTMEVTNAMNTALVFKSDFANKPLSVPVAWSTTPEAALAEHVARRARFLASRARQDADAAEKRATALAEAATRLEARAAELEAAVPAKPDGAA